MESGPHAVGFLAGWTCFSALIVSQAQGAIKTLEREIESLKSGGSEEPAATDSESTEPEDNSKCPWCGRRGGYKYTRVVKDSFGYVEGTEGRCTVCPKMR